jgi:type IV pilus assembly protein PilY1
VESTQSAQRGTLQRRTSTDNGPFSAWADAASCTPDNRGNNRTECRYVWADSAPTATCLPLFAQNNFSNATVFRNCNGTETRTSVASCTATPRGLDGIAVSCEYADWSVWSNAATCTPAARSTGPNFTVGTARECRVTTSGGTSNTLADIAAYYYNRDLRDPLATGVDATGTCTGPIVPPATQASNLCENNVEPFERDTSTKQHMTTHTLGLGAQGQMVYSSFQNDLTGQRVFQPDYWSQQTGDFASVANGAPASPSTGICPWMTAGTTCTWPTPAADSTANIDDLWHAAVNGHGTYFSAADPISLGDALSGMLGKIKNPPRPGTAAAAATSNPNVTPADRFVFSSSYRSMDWFGELIMQEFLNNALSPQRWSAMQLLDCATSPWRPGREYQKGDAFQQAGTCYGVRSTYTPGATFDGSPTGVDGQNTFPLNAGPVTRNIYTVGWPRRRE